MKKLFQILLWTALTATAGPVPAAECGSLADLRWLLGDWRADGSKSSFFESWSEVGPQTFEGTGIERSKPDGAVKSAESLRLVEMGGGVFYVAKVAHNELPVAFRLTACADGRFVFENPAHDFPRRIEYRHQETGRFSARVSDGAENGFTVEYVRQPATVSSGVPPDLQIRWPAVYGMQDGSWRTT